MDRYYCFQLFNTIIEILNVASWDVFLKNVIIERTRQARLVAVLACWESCIALECSLSANIFFLKGMRTIATCPYASRSTPSARLQHDSYRFKWSRYGLKVQASI